MSADPIATMNAASLRPQTDEPSQAEGKAAPGAFGELYVTRKCCGAGNCRAFAPELLAEIKPAGRGKLNVLPDSHDPSAFTGVIKQPETLEEYRAAREAVVSCAFNALEMSKPTADIPDDHRGSPWKRFPRQVEDKVWLLGRPEVRNFGAMSYFIELEGGGVLVDVPKPTEATMQWLEEHGGVRWIFITHVDHGQEHGKFAERFPDAERIISEADVNKRANPFIDAHVDVEVKIPSDLRPHALDGTPLDVEELPGTELALLPQPGHTPGCLCLLYKGRYLFTGDHLAYSREAGSLVGHRLQCWQDWERQTRSVELLQEWAAAGHVSFSWVLPGHGEWGHLSDEPSAPATSEALFRCVAHMKEQPPGKVPLITWIPYSLSRTKPDTGLARVVRWLGAGDEAWVLPKAARRYLPEYGEPRAAAGGARRWALATAVLAAGAALVVGVAQLAL